MMPAVGNLAGGYHDPVDARLRDLRALIETLVADGATRSAILGQVANGLTGEVNGYRERMLTGALTSAADLVADLTQDAAKTLERTRTVVASEFRQGFPS